MLKAVFFSVIFFVSIQFNAMAAFQTGCEVSGIIYTQRTPFPVYNSGGPQTLLASAYCVTTGAGCVVYGPPFPGGSLEEGGENIYSAQGTFTRFSTNPLDCPIDDYAWFAVLLLASGGFFLIKNRFLLSA